MIIFFLRLLIKSILLPNRWFQAILSRSSKIFRCNLTDSFFPYFLSFLYFYFPHQCLLISAGPNLNYANLFTSSRFSIAMCFSWRALTTAFLELQRLSYSLGYLDFLRLFISSNLAEWYFCLSCVSNRSGSILLYIIKYKSFLKEFFLFIFDLIVQNFCNFSMFIYVIL